ncbi:MAG: hypothetical protein WD672_01145 [Woeseia sp.]
MEQVGGFHFVLRLIPKGWFQEQSDPGQFADFVDKGGRRIWWIDYEPKISISEYCDTFLIRSVGSPYDYGVVETIWTDENHHRVELWQVETNLIAEMDIRIDVRYPFSAFLSRIVELTAQLDCVIYLEHERDFIEPSAVTVYEALRRSPAVRLAEKRLK